MLLFKGILETGQAVLWKRGSMGEDCICEGKEITPRHQNAYFLQRNVIRGRHPFTEDRGILQEKGERKKGVPCGL